MSDCLHCPSAGRHRDVLELTCFSTNSLSSLASATAPSSPRMAGACANCS